MPAATTDSKYGIPPYPVRLFTVEEYHRLGELGVLTEDDKVELLEGWIVPKVIHVPCDDKGITMTGGLDVAITSAAIPPYPVHTFSVEDYERLVETGVLTEDDKVELLEGWIVPMMTHGTVHGAIVGIVEEALRSAVPEGWAVRGQLPVATRTSMPEPDVAVVRGGHRDYMAKRPTTGDIGLVVEVADSSLARDRQKASIYAQADIPVYWIVNLIDKMIEVHSQPDPESGKYNHTEKLAGEAVVAFVLDGQPVAKLPVADLLPE